MAVLAAIVAGSGLAYGYATFTTARWPNGEIVMHEHLGTSAALIDGSSGWGATFEAALAFWNLYLDRAHFTVVRNSSVSTSDGNRLNNVTFSNTINGRAFGARTLAITLSHWSGSTMTEADIIFNNRWTWNSYRGNLRSTAGSTIYDFYRVALHESGHVLGLDHPDDYGQVVTAQMNSSISDFDTLSADDVNGGQSIYSSVVTSGAIVSFPPRNESLDFRLQLEAKYRDGLRRPAQATYVDNEGDVVWTQEYLRFRVNQCSHETAASRVSFEVDGGVIGVCGGAPAGQVNFPPRNESLDFRQQLEAKYRDTLRRAPSLSAVDNEGDVVWTQEYLRYRVNGCGHADAVSKVFLQIDGRGIQPLCR
jgi:hypothetical protein